MNASPTTKQRILDAAKTLVETRSFHSVGLQEILKTVQVPKGSFYHYFESKEDFGVELINYYVAQQAAILRQFFEDDQTPALQRFDDYWGFLIGQMKMGECRQSCLLAKFSLELGNSGEPMREVLASSLKGVGGIYEAAIRDGQRDGTIRKNLDAGEAAVIIQDLWQGALQRAQIEKSVAALRSAAAFLLALLKA